MTLAENNPNPYRGSFVLWLLPLSFLKPTPCPFSLLLWPPWPPRCLQTHKLLPTPGPLHMIIPLPGTLFLRFSHDYALSLCKRQLKCHLLREVIPQRPLSHQLQQYLSCDSPWFFLFQYLSCHPGFSFHSTDDQYLNLSQDFFKS